MSSPPERGRSGQARWGLGIATAVVLAVVLAGLAFAVPRLEVFWLDYGIAPPLYGRVLIAMTRNLVGVTLVGLALVALAFRRA